MLDISLAGCYDDKNNMRQFYFHQLTDVVMVSSNMLAAERLGGADYDGDMVKTIADPIINFGRGGRSAQGLQGVSVPHPGLPGTRPEQGPEE